MKYLLLVAVIFSVVACSGPGATNDAANGKIVQDYLDAVKNRDYDAMGALLADDYMGLGPAIGDTTYKAQAIESWKVNSENLYESVEYDFVQLLPATITDGPAKGEWVSNWAYVTIQYKDGRGPVNVWINIVYKIENGLIARSRTFYNEADVLAQLGYRVFPPLSVPEGIDN